MRTLWTLLGFSWSVFILVTALNSLAKTNAGLAGGVTLLTVIIGAGYLASRQ